MRETLIDLIQNSVDGFARNWAKIIADHLLANGVIVPPVKAGDTMYAVFESDEDLIIEPYTVSGVVYKKEEWFIIDNCGDLVKYGTQNAVATIEEAEQVFEKMRGEK